MNADIRNLISLLEIHAGFTEAQSKQLHVMAKRLAISAEDRKSLKGMGDIDADTAKALRNAIETLQQMRAPGPQ
jgi:hypothetical protein